MYNTVSTSEFYKQVKADYRSGLIELCLSSFSRSFLINLCANFNSIYMFLLYSPIASSILLCIVFCLVFNSWWYLAISALSIIVLAFPLLFKKFTLPLFVLGSIFLFYNLFIPLSCIFLTVALSYFVYSIYWQSLQKKVFKELLSNQNVFEYLWDSNLLAIKFQDGKIISKSIVEPNPERNESDIPF